MKALKGFLLPALLLPLKGRTAMVLEERGDMLPPFNTGHTGTGHKHHSPATYSMATGGSTTAAVNDSATPAVPAAITLTSSFSVDPDSVDPISITKTMSATPGVSSLTISQIGAASPAIIGTSFVTTDATLFISRVSVMLSTMTATATSTPSLGQCYEAIGGTKANGAAIMGCGSIIGQIGLCVIDQEQPEMWTDPYDTTRNEAFQACMCGTSATAPFDSNSAFNLNFTGCAQCLLLSQAVYFSDITHLTNKIDSFCRSQNPIAYLFLSSLDSWFNDLNTQIPTPSPTPTPALIGILDMLDTLSPVFTTTPPLANIAYGASAPSGGRYADVSPVLSTSITGSTTITEVASWVPTATGSETTHNSTLASASEAAAASSALYSALESAPVPTLCMGRGPCGLMVSSGQRGGMPKALLTATLLGLLLSVVVAM